ncbi:uncharacterized protein SCHCODRAFT_02632238 [Schizophyllum commune H4-8]|uniref:Uncharacterized protein n=1 Tax=Schizophyllum commune (strain H4-8 / FGSC 9210) TaxID=578458 RepID=D8Q937_SCHCM|nr:uncharacterized protein SCHCODRAFT_02632238 [Schizophyllum commune H4-8]KAI5890564.1 hypothetical protein SCHCODRAFT_02632238 [Schizophyllum commune H4-8]
MQNPPLIDPPKALSTDSAQDWAASTQNALAQSKEAVNTDMEQERNFAAPSTAASTPGIPGAYPRSYSTENASGMGAGLTAGATGLLQTAKDYLPQIPQSVASYFQGAPNGQAEHTTAADMPSQETADESLGKTAGAGALPGAPTEAAVAQLPDERWTEGVGAIVAPDMKPAATSDENGSAKAVLAGKEEADAKASAPEPQGSSTGISAPAPAGVGDLPGSSSEAAVTVLPDEKKSQHAEPEEHSSHRSTDNVEEKGTEKNSQSRTSLSPSAHDAANKHADQPTANTAARTHPLAGEGAEWHGVPLDEKSQQRLDRDPESLDRGELVTHPEKNNAVFSAHHNEESSSTAGRGSGHKKTGSSVSMSSSGSPRKSRFFDKIKGEAKIISGKLGHNEEKVAAGKRLAGKI